jgi:hypothetical protein
MACDLEHELAVPARKATDFANNLQRLLRIPGMSSIGAERSANLKF